MGALPKRKISKARKHRRRAHDHLEMPALSICPKCKKAKRPHYRCEFCGHYGSVESAGPVKAEVDDKKQTEQSTSSQSSAPKKNENKK